MLRSTRLGTVVVAVVVITGSAGFCAAAAGAPPSDDTGPPRAVRLGPGSQTPPAKRPVVVHTATDFRTGQVPSVPPPPSGVAGSEAALQAEWRQEVAAPLAAMRLASAIELTEARVQSYRDRLEFLERYNYYAPPFADRFSSSWVIPPARGIAPVRADAPVQLFSPSSSFAHSLEAAQNRLERAELELNALYAQRDDREATLPDEPGVPTLESVRARQEVVDAELARAQFDLKSLDRRLEQTRQLTRLTYSVPFSELLEEVELAKLQAELRVANLQTEQKLLAEHQPILEEMDSVRRTARQPGSTAR